MRWRWLLVLLCAALAFAPAPAKRKPAASPYAVEVLVERDGGDWTADFRFAKDAPAWAFFRSALTRAEKKPWRPQAWSVETPGVRLERRGWYDVLAATSGTVPRRVRVRFRPFPEDLLSDYDAALVFTNGATALFTGQFEPFPLASAAAADTLPIDPREADIPEVRTLVSFADKSGQVLHAGRRQARISLSGVHSYVLFGDTALVESKDIATILDPQLPPWLSKELSTGTVRLLGFYAKRLGPRAGPKPTAMASWAGPTPKLRSMGGSVLPGLVIMTFEGDGVLTESPAVRAAALWFLAHESAHFWLGGTVHAEASSQAWITEGGADLLGVRVSEALDPSFPSGAKLQGLLDECIALAKGKPIRTAAERNEQRVYYACGAMFGLAAESAAKGKGGDFFSFWRGLIAANRGDGVVSQQDWLGALTNLSGRPDSARAIAFMLDQGVPDPAAALATLFAEAGVAHKRDPGGRLRLT